MVKKFTQKDLISEGFWSNFKKPFRAIGGIAGAAVKGGARALDYVAPEITQPLHRFEAGVRDIGDQAKKGYDLGSGGLMKEYEDILLDSGYIMDKNVKVVDSGKNKVVVGYRIIDQDARGNPIPDHKKLSFIFDKMGNFKIINTSNQDTSKMNQNKPHKFVKKGAYKVNQGKTK